MHRSPRAGDRSAPAGRRRTDFAAASARAGARRGGSTRARSRRSCARRSRRRVARASPGPSASRSGSTRRSPSPRAGRRARGPAPAEPAARPLEELADVEVPRARDVALARIARVAAACPCTPPAPDVEDRQASHRRAALASSCRVGNARGFASRSPTPRAPARARPAPSSSSPSQPAMPPRRIATRGWPASSAICAAGIAPIAVAAVDEHEPLAARDAVPPQAQRDLLRELARRLPRPPPGGGEPSTSGREPGMCPRMCAFGPRTSPTTRSSSPRCSASHRSRRPPSQRGDDPYLGCDRGPLLESREPVGERREAVKLDTEHVARAQEPRDERDVREPVLRAAEVRPLAEQRVESSERGVERLGRAVLPPPKGVVGTGQLVVAEDESRTKARSAGSAGSSAGSG